MNECCCQGLRPVRLAVDRLHKSCQVICWGQLLSGRSWILSSRCIEFCRVSCWYLISSFYWGQAVNQAMWSAEVIHSCRCMAIDHPEIGNGYYQVSSWDKLLSPVAIWLRRPGLEYHQVSCWGNLLTPAANMTPERSRMEYGKVSCWGNLLPPATIYDSPEVRNGIPSGELLTYLLNSIKI